ncbi:MAG: hypothetical protein ACYCYQ_05600 [Acidimicrobiales bacterium]
MTDSGFGALASPVIEASNRTGARLSQLIDSAPTSTGSISVGTGSRHSASTTTTTTTTGASASTTTTTGASASTTTTTGASASTVSIPGGSARLTLQQGLDQAVADTAAQVRASVALTPPPPEFAIDQRLVAIMTDRAIATRRLRSAIDGLLGMEPLPVANSPLPVGKLISVSQASTEMTATGALFVGADAGYQDLVRSIADRRLPIRIPRSVWVPSPAVDAPLGPNRLGTTASLLAGSSSLAPVNLMVITALGLDPPSIATGAPGVIGQGCSRAQSTGPGTSPTVVPSTGTLTVAATVTNCGNVAEAGIAIVQSLALADPLGTRPPPADARGSRNQVSVSVQPGASVAPALPSLVVSSGHRYLLTVSVATPAGQTNSAGSSQVLLLQIGG